MLPTSTAWRPSVGGTPAMPPESAPRPPRPSRGVPLKEPDPGNPSDEEARASRLAGPSAVGRLNEGDEAGAKAEPERGEEKGVDGAATREGSGILAGSRSTSLPRPESESCSSRHGRSADPPGIV